MASTASEFPSSMHEEDFWSDEDGTNKGGRESGNGIELQSLKRFGKHSSLSGSSTVAPNDAWLSFEPRLSVEAMDSTEGIRVNVSVASGASEITFIEPFCLHVKSIALPSSDTDALRCDDSNSSTAGNGLDDGA